MSGVFGPALALSVVLGAFGAMPPGTEPQPILTHAPVASPTPEPSSAAVISPPAGSTAMPSASPGPDSSAAGHLKEIGHVHASTEFCKSAVERTTTGITLLLQNDQRLGDMQNILRTNDFDYSEITRMNGIRLLTAQSVAFRAAAVTGNGQMALLKAQLKDSPTPEQKTALLALQEALDGALMRQKRLGDRIGRMIVTLQVHDRLTKEDKEKAQFDAIQAENTNYGFKDPEGPIANLPWSLDDAAKDDIKDITDVSTGITLDENNASDRMDAAFAGCL